MFNLDRIPLGQTGIQISPLGIGSNAWGAGRKALQIGGQADPAMRAVFEAALAAGINLFDTAEVYNFGGSEKTYGLFLPEFRSQAPLREGEQTLPTLPGGGQVVVASKFFPYPWRWSRAALKAALQSSLARLHIRQIDLYLVHFPLPPVRPETWVEALAEVHDAGLARAVGVSNFNAGQMRRAHALRARRGIPLACNQVEYSLLKRDVERNGLLALCKELGVTLVAYRPLAYGMLTGRYTAGQRPGGWRGLTLNRRALQAAQPLLELLRTTGEAHEGKTTAQVALNWLICKGAVPIPGASRAGHVQANAAALGWRLSNDEVAALDQASSAV